jgi:hypothetical protein
MINDPRLKNARLTDDEQMVLVRYLVEGYNNQTHWEQIDRALLGLAHGKWELVQKDLPNTYETRVMLPKKPDEQAEKSPVLTRTDMYGKDSSTLKGQQIKKKLVAWVQDNFLRGGAEISNEVVKKVGWDCGFSIIDIYPEHALSSMDNVLKECDLIIINNIWGFSVEQMHIILTKIYSERKPYVKYEHDHREFKRPEFSRRLFQNSVFNVFLSPLHLKNHQNVLGVKDGICLPLAFDVDLFRADPAINRAPNAALISNLRNFKTWNQLVEFINGHTNYSYTVLTNDTIDSLIRATSRPMVSYESMPMVYSEYEYLIHILDGFGAGERVIFEAALCGCKIIANDHVGHISWERDLTDTEGLREWLRQAPYDFWRAIDEVIG